MMVITVPAPCDDSITIEMDIAPSTLNLAYEGTIVTVHTNIPYSCVDGATVTLDGIPISWWKSDNRGNFVAKFDADDVKDFVEPGSYELTLSGFTTDGGSFSGSGTITVVENTGRDWPNKVPVSPPAIRTFQKRVQDPPFRTR